MQHSKKTEISLFFMRISVFLVIFMWTIDKFINPGHAAQIFEKFYYISGLEGLIIYSIGAIEMIILLLFLFGIKKKFSYGFVLAIHSVSTFSSFGKYLSPFDGNLLFFAAWPMLAACLMLFLFRKEDTLFQVNAKYA